MKPLFLLIGGLALAGCATPPAEAWWLAEHGTAEGPDVARRSLLATEICDLVDNDGDGTTDEGCGVCDWLVTRTKADWLAATDAINADGTCDLAILPITLGASRILSSAVAVRTELNAPMTSNAKQRLGTWLTVAKLNAAVYPIVDIPFHDWDADGSEETVQELLDLGDLLYDGGGDAERIALATALESLSLAGATLESWYDLTCTTAHELCNGADDDLDGVVDDGCLCVEELCDVADNDGDGAVDEGLSCELGVADLGPGDLVLSEILVDPQAVGDRSGEWFELANRTGFAVDLDGLEVGDGDREAFTVTGPLVVPALGHAVLGRVADSALNGGAAVDYAYGSGLTLGNGADALVLSAGAVVIDEVAWDGGYAFPDPTGASLQLDSASVDAAANDDGAAWCAATAAFGDGDLGTPGATNDACPEVVAEPDVVVFPANLDLGEVAVGCAVAETLWVVNRGGAPALVTDVVVDGSSSFSVDGTLPRLLDPGEAMSLEVTVTPTTAGLQVAEVTVVSDDPDGDAWVDLEATALAGTPQAATFEVGAPTPVDILWVLDRSCSMTAGILGDLSLGWPQIEAALGASGLDWQMVILDEALCQASGLFTPSTSNNRVRWQGSVSATVGFSGFEDHFRIAGDALRLTDSASCNAGVLRSGATLELVFVADEDDQSSLTTADWLATFQSHAPAGLRVSAITLVDPTCSSWTLPTRLPAMVSSTGGTLGDVCGTLGAEAAAVVADIPGGNYADTLPLAPGLVEETIQVTLDGVLTESWTYDPLTGELLLGAVPPDGTVVGVSWTEAGVCL